jgi:hypothetical protein
MIERGTILAFDPASHRATVRLDAAAATSFSGVPASASIAAWQLPVGRRVTLGGLDPFSSGERLVLAADGPPPAHPAVRAGATAGQSIPNLAWTSIALDSEAFDGQAMHDVAVANTRLVAASSGVHLALATVAFQTNGAGHRYLRLRRNGAGQEALSSATPLVTDITTLQVVALVRMAAGEYVEAEVFQSSGGALAIESPAVCLLWAGA